MAAGKVELVARFMIGNSSALQNVDAAQNICRFYAFFIDVDCQCLLYVTNQLCS